MYQQQRRGFNSFRRGGFNRQMGPNNGRYNGVVVPTAMQETMAKETEAAAAE